LSLGKTRPKEHTLRPPTVSNLRFPDENAGMARSHPFRQAGEVLRKPADLEIAELEARVAAAKAALEAAQEEVQQVTVAAPVAGVVSRLDVRPGMTAEAGAPAWGEILDLSEIDVRCDLTPQEADGVAVGDVAVVMQEGVQDGH
jgi:multidrug resistance efflux pump